MLLFIEAYDSMNDGESKPSWNMGDMPSMCYDCDMVYSLLEIGGRGEYEALQYKMDSSSMSRAWCALK